MGQLAQTQTTLTPTKPGSTTVENWKDLIFLVREPNRKGRLAWFIRVQVGDLDPWRYGPYADEKEARAEFKKMLTPFRNAIVDALCSLDDGGQIEH